MKPVTTGMYFIIVYLFVNIISFSQAETVRTEYGFVESDLILQARTGKPYHAFQGIPYAAPPVGKLRFQPPQEHPGWQGVRNATETGEECVQISPGDESLTVQGSEDCLFINVYTDNIRPEKLKSVAVFIHGGQFSWGSGAHYDSVNFMTGDIVFVTFNFRVGVFGYLTAGDTIIPGNYALKDQAAALTWVKKNIEAFGGNPEAVTLIGQSSGANNVHFHTLSPASKDLFHQAILMSGSAVALWSYFPEKSQATKSKFTEFLSTVDCIRSTTQESLLCLQALSEEELKLAENSLLTPNKTFFIFHPVVEPAGSTDAFIVEDPRKLNYQNPQMPLIVGTCSTEGLITTLHYINKYSDGTDFSEEFTVDLPSTLMYTYWARGETVGFITSMLKKFYIGSRIITVQQARQITQLHGDLLFIMPGIDTVISYPGTRYMYQYGHTNNNSAINSLAYLGVTGATHGDDLTVLFTGNLTGTDLEISEGMTKRFLSFITTGNPNSGEARKDQWIPVKSQELEYLYITQDDFKMESGIAEKYNYKFYKSIPFDWLELGSTNTVQ